MLLSRSCVSCKTHTPRQAGPKWRGKLSKRSWKWVQRTGWSRTGLPSTLSRSEQKSKAKGMLRTKSWPWKALSKHLAWIYILRLAHCSIGSKCNKQEGPLGGQWRLEWSCPNCGRSYGLQERTKWIQVRLIRSQRGTVELIHWERSWIRIAKILKALWTHPH